MFLKFNIKSCQVTRKYLIKMLQCLTENGNPKNFPGFQMTSKMPDAQTLIRYVCKVLLQHCVLRVLKTSLQDSRCNPMFFESRIGFKIGTQLNIDFKRILSKKNLVKSQRILNNSCQKQICTLYLNSCKHSLSVLFNHCDRNILKF